MGGAPDTASDVARPFNFRPLQAADLPMLHGWLSRPHWTQWWGPAPTLAEVQADYGAWINDPAQVQPHIANPAQSPRKPNLR